MQCSINKMLLTLSNWVGYQDDPMSSAFKKKGLPPAEEKHNIRQK